MSANLSRSKRDEKRRAARLAELKPFLVPGWQISSDNLRVVAVATVLGFYQRGQEMLLKCGRRDCHRRVEIDFRAAVQAGRGDQPPQHLIQALRCGHWDGCKLEEVSAIYPKGVPLVAYLNDKDVLIAIACEQCPARVLLPPRAIIERLKQARRGDGSTGILELGRRIRGPCRRCGGREFRSEVLPPKAPGRR
ncbi:hypothetical protein [Sphingosinicella humi]|uniref:Uncharacterized protein n=1 Tax=Allosphingosinicella humi TaxID=2068657 RepID=A0A2U2J574_9SPHN|nr:hypothetical protein [Sphingosinicella humi]PWG03490.1 hypothetical protein DF286_11875 [Sphingosinicella humi]